MMEDNMRGRLKEILKGTFEVIDSRRKLTNIAMNIWHNSMKRFELTEIENAFMVYINTPGKGQFIPKPADIIEIIDGSIKSNAALAWTKFIQAVERVGIYQTVCFDDPIIHRVVEDMGGWVFIGESATNTNLPFLANDFKFRYESYKSKFEIPTHQNRLLGIIEAENTRNGYLDKIDDPVMIGDKIKATSVLENKIKKQISWCNQDS